jgi:acetylglutamate kinase
MIPKIKHALSAEEKDVGSVHILDGTKPHRLLHELFTEEGIGTMIE